ncbi:MAG: hypothetical protein JJU02_03155, partial [Cryomorphaceae bacterium]|nr:hypothetical protein [Cryomorphaceae bacterium]
MPLFMIGQTIPTPTSKDHVAFAFTCEDPGASNMYEINFPGEPITDFTFIDKIGVSGLSFDDPLYSASGEFEVNVNQIDDYREFGVVAFSGNQDGNEVTINVYFVKCCEDIPFSGEIIAEPHPMSFWADVSNPNSIDSKDVLVLGEISVDLSLDINSSQMFMGTDASFILDSDINITVSGSVFQAYCKYFWDGIHAHNSSNSVDLINDSYISDGLRAIYLRNNASFVTNQTIFDNNPNAVILMNYGSSSSIDIIDNEFRNTTGYLTMSHHPLSTIDMSSYQISNSPGGATAIFSDYGQALLVSSVNDIDIGPDNIFTSEAIHYYHITLEGTNAHLFENEFYNNVEAIRAYNSNCLFGGSDPSDENYVEECSMYIELSGTHFQNNEFQGGNIGSIKIINPSQFTGSGITPNADGVIIEENLIENYHLVEILNQSFFQQNRDYHIFSNLILNTNVRCENLDYSVSNSKRLRVEDNNFQFDPYEYPTYEIYLSLINCFHPRVTENNFWGNDGETPEKTTAIHIEDCQEAQVLENGIYVFPTIPEKDIQDYYSFQYGITFKGNCSNSDFYCNKISNPRYGINLIGASLSDFGGAAPDIGTNNLFSHAITFSSQMVLAITGSIMNSVDYFYYDESGSSSLWSWTTDPSVYGISVTNAPFNSQGTGEEGCIVMPSYFLSENKEDSYETEGFNLFPNPSNGMFHFTSEQESTLTLLNGNGQVVFH